MYQTVQFLFYVELAFKHSGGQHAEKEFRIHIVFLVYMLQLVNPILHLVHLLYLMNVEVQRVNLIPDVLRLLHWLLGRQREESVGEEENLYIPPSSSLAGKIYNTLMSQVVAGKKFGGLNEVESVRFDLRKSEISELERMGLVPMVNEYSKVMAFSAKTLFNGDNLGLQTYSVVRVFDYITKVLIDFLNRRAFENWTTRTEADLRGQVVKFLDSVMGPNKLIERFKVMKIEQDPNQKDRVLLDIHITPYFPAKSFVIQLAGHKGDNPEDAIWESEYHQE